MSPQQHAEQIDELVEKLNSAISYARHDGVRVDVDVHAPPRWGNVQVMCSTPILTARELREQGRKRSAQSAEMAHGNAASPGTVMRNDL